MAAECLAHGNGTWDVSMNNASEPYLLGSELRLGRENRHWWGVCDADLFSNQSNAPRRRAPRQELLHQWVPEGHGCSSLRKGREALPELSALACAFCARHAGRTVLFVGDSVQGELFLSFASILDALHVTVNPGNQACRKVAPRGSGPREVDVSITVCGDGERAITARFIRNERLWLDEKHNARHRHPDRRFGAPALMLCDWKEAASTADMLVLNRGYHSLTDPDMYGQLAELNDTLLSLATLWGGQGALHDRVAYRGTHGSLHNCFTHPDPIVRPWAEISATMGSRSNALYNWRAIEGRESQTKPLVQHFGVPYVDTFVSTSYRPAGGRMPPNNCNHFCLPGPVDQWTRLLLAIWT